MTRSAISVISDTLELREHLVVVLKQAAKNQVKQCNTGVHKSRVEIENDIGTAVAWTKHNSFELAGQFCMQ